MKILFMKLSTVFRIKIFVAVVIPSFRLLSAPLTQSITLIRFICCPLATHIYFETNRITSRRNLSSVKK